MSSNTTFIFFGSSQMSIYVLDELEKAGYMPKAVVTTPDKPVGRKQVLTPTPVKEWAQKRNINVYDPAALKISDPNGAATIERLKNDNADIFIVASYGKIIPKEVFDIPPYKTLNVHPSLLPKYRGASPLQSAILDDEKNTGVTIIRIDEQMDHGPIVAQESIHINEWPVYEKFEEMMAHSGGHLLVDILPDWISGKIDERPQDETKATYCKKFTKEDGLIDLNDEPYLNFRKIQAFHMWPQAYFFIDHNSKQTRIKITDAEFKSGQLVINKVVPEGSKEIKYEDFRRGYDKR